MRALCYPHPCVQCIGIDEWRASCFAGPNNFVTYSGRVGSKHCTGDSPLHVAARRGDAAILQLLLEQRPVIGWQNKGGSTVLHECVACADHGKRRECARLLLAERRLPFGVLNKNRQTAADACRDVDLRELIRDAMEARRSFGHALWSNCGCFVTESYNIYISQPCVRWDNTAVTSAPVICFKAAALAHPSPSFCRASD